MQAEVHLNDVRVSEDRILGELDNAFYDAMSFLGLGRVEIGARAVGNAEWLLDRATEYANEREAFGNAIGQFQSISHKIARGRANVLRQIPSVSAVRGSSTRATTLSLNRRF